GTASDAGSGVQQVEIRIQRPDLRYWDGDSWEVAVTWLLTTGTTSWTYDSSGITWTVGNNKVRSRATDYAGNVQSPTTENTFIYNTAPISQINVPADGAYYNGLASISGVASDNSGTGLSKVEITIQRLSDFQYWDGTLWTSSETWLTAVGPWVSWSYSTLPTWVDGQSYRVRSRATDNVPTVESPTSGNTFTIDTTIPSSTITYPIHGTTLPILTSITGTASDTGSGLDKVQILIEDSGTYWTGSTWGGATWLDVSGTSSWSYDSSMVLWPAGPATIVIKSRAHDNAGNVESPGLGVTITFDITFTDFSISATPTSELIGRGDNATFVIEVTSIYGNEGPGGETIVLSLSSLPAGATGGFAPLFSPTISVTIFSGSSAYSTLTVDTDASVAPGTYLITVYGDNFATSITHSVDITLDIGDFGVYVAPPNQTLVRGSADHANYTVTVKSLATFSDTVDLTVSGWSNFTFDSSAVTPTTAGTITTLTIWVPYTISTGSFNFTVYGTSGNQTHHANASIAIVTPPGFRIDDFRVTINPSQSLIGPGDSTTYTVNCTSLYRYESVVELTLVGLPDGATASFTEEIINIPTDGSVFSTLTVTTDSSILLGTYYLTVYGTSSAPLTRSAIATLDIGDYKVTTDPIIQEVVLESQSSNVEYTVIVTSLGTTGDFVDLTLTGWPNHNFAASRVLPTTSGTTTTLTINVPYTSNTGTYVLNIFGTDSNQTHSTKAILIVDMEPDFVIAVDPVSKTAEKDSTATFSAIVTSLNGFTAPVQLSVPSWPANLTGSFNPSTVTISSAGGIASSTLSIPIPADAPVGTYAFNITGTSGPISHKTSATLTITEAEEPSGPGMQCIIATSTYGSELSPEVQFLRSFRDQTVMSTFSGKQFMNVFNTWYYSFSPPVAGTIESNTPIKSMMKVVLYPLIGTLHVAAYVNSIVAGLSTELAMVTTGLVASALIGAVYLAPIALLLLYVFRRYYGLKFNTYPLKVLGGMLLVSLALLILGTFIMAPAIVMFSTAILVVSTLALGGIGLAFIVIQRPLKT
ncbi:CFI-box-CTERM domain-containing protein, partial [[Eubacterium] cellulosolvens]